LPDETIDPSEFRHIRRDQSRSASSGLRGDQQVIGADRGSCRFQRGAQIAGSRGVFFGERNDSNSAGQENAQSLRVLAAAFAAGNAVPQLVENDR